MVAKYKSTNEASKHMKQKNLLYLGAALASAAALGVLLDALFLEKYFFEIKQFDIGRKDGGKSLKLALVTDLHFKHRVLPQYEKLAGTINELHPDLLLITGDILDSGGKLETARRFFEMLQQSIRKVAVPGNNDYEAETSISQLRKMLEKYNCNLLVNESKVYEIRDTRLMVTGLDDLMRGQSNLSKAVDDIPAEENHILLVHNPLHHEHAIEELEKINSKRNQDNRLSIDYVFAGHTHGGQVRLPGYVPVLPPRSGNYVNGWYNDKPPYLYVSRGFGTSTLPFRFFARSELTVFNYCV